MKIYSSLQIGEYHENNCEDNLYVGEFGKDKLLCAVMDGCTMGVDSHFASGLVAKILHKICIEEGYKEFIAQDKNPLDIEEHLKLVVKNVLTELKIIKNQLMLDTKELLTTLIITIIDKNREEGIMLAIGDGFVSINGNSTEFEQDNKPDYLGFHLFEDFEVFYNSQKQKIKFDRLSDISISTDGIFTFEKLTPAKSNEEIDIIDFLSIDKTDSEKDEMLGLKLKVLENKFGLKPTDDFSMIRIIKNN